MKTILLLAHEDEGQEARLQVALDVTRALGGHLSCVDGIAMPVALAYDAYGDVAVAEQMAAECQRETANEARLKQRLALEDVAWNWIDASGFLDDSLEAASELADLVVVSIGLDIDQPADLRHLASHLAKRLRRPLLAVPQDMVHLDARGTALIAWDGSHAAEQALREAVPLLRLASKVIVFAVAAPGDDIAPAQAARYLSQHGIHASVACADRKPGGGVCAAILDKARAVGAAYVVMGAYGHSAALEAVFGGVTRSMLATSRLPLFLAHR